MKDSQLTATTAEEMLKILQGADYETAYGFHEFGQKLGCKIEPHTGAKRYRIQYSLKKPKRGLFTIECNAQAWRIKANLFHIDFYHDIAQLCSEDIKSSIKKTRACTGCNSRCADHPFYTLDGAPYRPCYGSGHYFSGLCEKDWSGLKTLLVQESRAI